MAREKVIVKRLISVEDLGNIDTLCADKTGTLTEGKFTLSDFRDLADQPQPGLVTLALLCSTGFTGTGKALALNATDQAIWDSDLARTLKAQVKSFKLLDENEFDFDRKRISVLVKHGQESLLIVKGAPESVIQVSDHPDPQTVLAQVNRYEQAGFRVIAVAQKPLRAVTSTPADETGVTLTGFLLFSDPIKSGVGEALADFRHLGVSIKILTGDSPTVTKSIIIKAGLATANPQIITGDQLAHMSPSELAQAAQTHQFFARITPEQKYQIVASLNRQDHIVGFLGDGVNDAPALKAADVGIAVDSGAPVAKDAADIILTQKDLEILGEGIESGRNTFANIMKYILNTISANFGNMFTVAGSSLFLKFIPLLPSQILLNNLISDIPLLAVATDKVDHEFSRRPKRWNFNLISHFMLYFGIISSLFDLSLILPLIIIWKVSPEVFRTAWFVESSLSEIIVTFAIRTRLPFFRSLPSLWLLGLSLLSGLFVAILPLIKFGQQAFRFAPLSSSIWLLIASVVISYFATVEIAKHYFFKRFEL